MKKNLSERFLTEAQFKSEVSRCEFCKEKPCKDGCPADCSPADFIMAARLGEKQDFLRAAGMIMKNNPLGGVCGAVCPDRFCQKKCSHKKFDVALKIPEIQAYIVQRAKELGGIPPLEKSAPSGKKVAIIGAGPAGLTAAATLAQMGFSSKIFEEKKKPGGALNLIPDFRLPREIINTDIEFIKMLDVEIITGRAIQDPASLLEKFDAVVVATGLWRPILPGIQGQEKAITMIDYLGNPKKYKFSGKVAVIGGGATAVDCAVTLKKSGVKEVEMFALETLSEMPLTEKERREIFENSIQVTGRTSVSKILVSGGKVKGIQTVKVALKGEKFSLKDIKPIKETEQKRNDISAVIISIGTAPNDKFVSSKGIFFAGDRANGPTTVVEAVASGKNAAQEVKAFLLNQPKPKFHKATKSAFIIPGWVSTPVSVEAEFFGRKISTPFLLSAAPPSDGYDQMKKAYEYGWSGGVMKTAFDNVPIHIPCEYMHRFNESTYGNCDNVSGHSLDRVCREVERLRKEFPDRLTMASTGGPVTGNDESDKAQWQSNTKKLENAGAMGIEYSLSCPQGGDGTEGDIVSQNPVLTAKIVDWIMQISDPQIPKLFKLTGAVTSIVPIIRAIKEVFKKYPGKKAGVTLANTFPTIDFQKRKRQKWEEGVVLGMSGEGVVPISYKTLVDAVGEGVVISGNGGVMNYKQAAHFLAIGVKTVQVCTIVMKYGYGIFDELVQGVSFLMKERGIKSMKELIGWAQPVVTDFMSLSATKKISSLLDKDLCVSCGNCANCPYQAITLNSKGFPETDPAKCIGCSLCVQKCFTGALYMRERTPEELALLKED